MIERVQSVGCHGNYAVLTKNTGGTALTPVVQGGLLMGIKGQNLPRKTVFGAFGVVGSTSNSDFNLQLCWSTPGGLDLAGDSVMRGMPFQFGPNGGGVRLRPACQIFAGGSTGGGSAVSTRRRMFIFGSTGQQYYGTSAREFVQRSSLVGFVGMPNRMFTSLQYIGLVLVESSL